MGENYMLHAPSVLLSGKYIAVPISCEPMWASGTV